MAIILGTTSRIPPETPDLAGRPTCNSHMGYTDKVVLNSRLSMNMPMILRTTSGMPPETPDLTGRS